MRLEEIKGVDKCVVRMYLKNYKLSLKFLVLSLTDVEREGEREREAEREEEKEREREDERER